jgi:hypothetical protein
MKAKLLRKIRKRFSIHHYPNGVSSFGEIYDYNIFELVDSTNSWGSRSVQLGRKMSKLQYVTDDRIFDTEKECIDYLKSDIVRILRKEGHIGKKDRDLKKFEKVWFN